MPQFNRSWRYAYNTNGLAHHRLADAVDLVADLGYEVLALTPDVGHLDPRDAAPADVARLDAHLRRRGLGVTLQTGARFTLDPRRKHQPNLLDPDPAARRIRLDALVRCLDIARDLGAPVLSFWSGVAPEGAAPDSVDARLRDGCRSVAEAAALRGLVAAFEPEPGMWTDTVQKWVRLAAAVDHPAFRLSLDVGHVHCNREGDPAEIVRSRRRRHPAPEEDRTVRTPSVSLALVAALACGACASDPGTAGPGRLSGRIVTDRLPPDAQVEAYRVSGGVAAPLAGTSTRPDSTGRFRLPPLVPGRYVVVLRTRENPPSTQEAEIPGREEVEMRIAPPAPGSSVTLVSPSSAAGSRTCRLSPARPRGLVPDRREVVIAPGQEIRLDGLAPGLWHMDVLPDGATADFEVAKGDAVAKFVIDPPAQPASGTFLEGTVRRQNGAPAYGAAVTVRTTDASGMKVEPWGRVALVDDTGRWQVSRLLTGTTYVRVESRDAALTSVPVPELIVISPSGGVLSEYVVQP